ncbi:MAG: hypothetical protein AAFZ15_16990 [Bacteroidota bacterium]
MKTSIKFLPINKINNSLKNNMWDIYKKYYSYSETYFKQRITKNTHFAFFYEGKQLVGFTGLRINKIKVANKKTLLLYFGQAVIETKYRSKNLLARMSIIIGRKYFWDLLFSDGYCWCDTISFKSYLFFAKSMAEFYPTYREETPIKEELVIFNIGETFYPDSFSPMSGTVKKEKNYVNDPAAIITKRHLSSPDINFYATANPGYAQGHGLITIVPMSIKNLMHLVRKSIKKQILRKKRKLALRSALPFKWNYRVKLQELVLRIL